MYLDGICFITDRTIGGLGVEEQVRVVLDAGISFVQYREKNLARREIYFQAESLRKLTAEYGATFIVNDHCDIALAVDADGVHLGQEDLPLAEARKIMGQKIIGISTHSLVEAEAAEQGGADYIGFGPIFHTSTKDAGVPKGVEGIEDIRRHVRVPIVAIGGISHDRVPSIMGAGADAVAVASSILREDDVYTAARRFVETVSNSDR